MSQKLPAGSYFICDPCYVIPEVDWDRYVMEVQEDTVTDFTLSNGQVIKCWWSYTQYGDGTYTAQSYLGTEELGVDSGTIGVTQVFENHKNGSDSQIRYNPGRAFEVKCEDGVFNIGCWEINTGYDTYQEDISELDFDLDDIDGRFFDD